MAIGSRYPLKAKQSPNKISSPGPIPNFENSNGHFLYSLIVLEKIFAYVLPSPISSAYAEKL